MAVQVSRIVIAQLIADTVENVSVIVGRDEQPADIACVHVSEIDYGTKARVDRANVDNLVESAELI